MYRHLIARSRIGYFLSDRLIHRQLYSDLTHPTSSSFQLKEKMAKRIKRLIRTNNAKR